MTDCLKKGSKRSKESFFILLNKVYIVKFVRKLISNEIYELE